MELEIVRADPAGNITVFVLSPVEDRDERAAAVSALMADPALKAEQVGFVLQPLNVADPWRLEMMGGEFCGNAAFGQAQFDDWDKRHESALAGTCRYRGKYRLGRNAAANCRSKHRK